MIVNLCQQYFTDNSIKTLTINLETIVVPAPEAFSWVVRRARRVLRLVAGGNRCSKGNRRRLGLWRGW